jgi:hypothetical protein
MPRIIASDIVALHPTKPSNTILDELLPPRSKLRLMQRKVIDSPDPKDTHTRKPLPDTIHQGTTSTAEIISHEFTRRNRLAIRVLRELVAAAHMGQVAVANDEVGGEHGSRDFAAVCAVADERVDETWGRRGLGCVSMHWEGRAEVMRRGRLGRGGVEAGKGMATHECKLHSATVACRCCLILFRPPVAGESC